MFHLLSLLHFADSFIIDWKGKTAIVQGIQVNINLQTNYESL